MEISTMEEAIPVKRLGIIRFLRRKISLSKTLKSGLLNKYSALGLSRTSAQTWTDKALLKECSLECSRSNTINMSLCSQVGRLPFPAAVILEFIFRIMCLSQGSSVRTMAWLPVVCQLGGVGQHIAVFEHGGLHIFSSCSLSLPIEWCSVVQLFFKICSVSFYRAVHLGQWGNGVKVLLYLVSWQKWCWDLLIIFFWVRNHMPK